MRFCTKVVCAVVVLTVFGYTQAHAVEPLVGFGVIDLTKHEGVGKAHTIENHVNKSDKFLKNRLEDKYEIKNQAKIDEWKKRCEHKTFGKLRKGNLKAKSNGLIGQGQAEINCKQEPKPECKKVPMTSFESLDYANSMINKMINDPTRGIKTCVWKNDRCELTTSVLPSSHNSYGYIRNDKCEIVKVNKSQLNQITAVIAYTQRNNPEYWYVLTMYPSRY